MKNTVEKRQKKNSIHGHFVFPSGLKGRQFHTAENVKTNLRFFLK